LCIVAASACAVLSGCVAGDANVRAAPNIDDLMRPYTGVVPSASVLVLRDGVPVLRRSYGLANLEEKIAATPQTNYRLASMTKQFTASAILLLAEDGKLSLDDRIRHWLPSLPTAADAITIRHLLTHTGGLIDYEDIMPESPAVPAAPTSPSALPPTSAEVIDDPSKQLRDIDVLHLLEKTDHLYFAPGTSYRYSNGGYSMLALIVERASGKSFQDFLRQRIFEPLAMHDTLAYVREGPPVPHRAYGYAFENGKWIRTDQSLTSAVLGDGGVYSSIDDLAKWDAASYDNRLLSDASRQLAFTPWTKTDDPAVRYGFGIRLTGDTQWHSGETIGFRNVMVRWPQRHLSVIVLTNRNDPEPYRLALKIGDRFLK
jgi:CubicO group peptidase (beta-lactamase class C family)